MNEIQSKQVCDKAIALKGQIEKSAVFLASLLLDIRDNRLYCPQYDRFPEFLQELDMSESTASRMITSYQKLILEYKIPTQEVEDIGWSKGYLVAKNAQTREEAVELVDLAREQTTKDLEISLKEMYKGIDQSTCEHQWQTFRICKRCGLKEIVE